MKLVVFGSGCRFGFLGLGSLLLGSCGLRCFGGRLRCRYGIGHLRTIVKLLYKSSALKRGLLEIIAEFECILRTGRYAKHAECAATQIVKILVELALLLSVGKLHHLGLQSNRAVGAVHLADTAGDTFVATLGIILERELGAETLRDIERGPVFRIALSNLRRNEFLSRYLHAAYQALYPLSY